MTMSTPNNWLLSATTNPESQANLADTLNTIMAQLTSIDSRLDLQGATLARHAQLLGGIEGSTAPNNNPLNQIIAGVDGAVHGSGTSGGIGGTEGHTHNPHPPPRDYRDDLRNSFHRPKLNFPHYDGESDPLPWLNHCESYFRGT
jgi:hypothetical protein